MQVPHARIGHFLPILVRGWISEQNTFLHVALHLPNIARVRLIDVNNEERDPVLILLIQLVERGNLPAKGRSSVTAEDENNRLPAPKGRQADRAGMVKKRKSEIGGCAAYRQMASPRAFPHRLEWKQEEGHWSHVHHHARKCLRRLMHRIIEEAQNCEITSPQRRPYLK